jgi:pimeloyl-ACP methyl ester carboxylesterase
MHPSLLRKALAAVVAAVLLSASLESSRAAVIVLVDGFILKGKKLDRDQKEMFSDPVSGQVFTVSSGFNVVDDGARRIIYSPKQILPNLRAVNPVDIDANPDLVELKRERRRMFDGKLESIGPIDSIGEFDENWDRVFRFRANVTAKNPAGLVDPEPRFKDIPNQKLVLLTPHYARVDAFKWVWSQFYATREISPETVRLLLHNHPEVRAKGGRSKAFLFLKQAGMYDAADQELTDWLEDEPAARAKIGALRSGLLKLRAEQWLADLERGYQVGRHDWVRKKIEDFPTERVDDKQQAQLRALKSKYETANAALKEARRLLGELPTRVPPGNRKTWDEATRAILDELTVDSVPRLEKFLQYAQQAERRGKAGEKPGESAEDLLARAVGNWLLASTAPAKADEGLSLWRTRQFVLEYQRTANAGARAKLLASYEKEGALPFDELAQLISLLPPPEPEAKIDQSILELETKQPAARRKGGIPYILQLPDEYTHSRRYPVLLVLHHAGDKPAEFLAKWADLATANGYLLVAPDWTEGGKRRAYGYSADEHAAVTDVLRDLQRRFNVDSDRVFLAGFGEGGAMAFDVGESHPDLFAGVVTMAAQPRFFSQKYASNAGHLPFYVIAGDLQYGDCRKTLHRQFSDYFACNARALLIEYKGRGLEWFGGELASAFDWMNHQKGRLNAFPETTEFHAMRESDNRFSWLTVDGIEKRCLGDVRNAAEFYRAEPAKVSASIKDGTNIHVHSNGFKNVTVWLGLGMINFDKPVTLTTPRGDRFRNRKLTPSLSTLLEDFYERGDRSRLFVVKIPPEM